MTQAIIKRPKSSPHKDVRLLNHKEDIHLQWKLQNIRAKHRLNLRLLEQDRALALKEHKRLVNLRGFEPDATVKKTMKAISEVKMANRISKSAPGFRSRSSPNNPQDDTDSKDLRCLKSASCSFTQEDSYPFTMFVERFKVSEDGRLSILHLKDLALIDNISQKELMFQEEYHRWCKERLKQIQREKLREKIKSFLNSIEHIQK